MRKKTKKQVAQTPWWNTGKSTHLINLVGFFFVGSKRVRFHEWETALLLLHFVRASSKTMEELDGVGCKVLRMATIRLRKKTTSICCMSWNHQPDILYEGFCEHLDSISSRFKGSCGTVLWNLRCSLRCRSRMGSSCDCVCFPSGRKGEMKSLKKDRVTRRFKSQQEAVFCFF